MVLENLFFQMFCKPYELSYKHELATITGCNTITYYY